MSTQVAKKEATGVVKAKATPAERFSNTVLKQFGDNTPGKIQVSDFQRKLIQNYFIKLDSTLQEAETKRLSKSEQYRDSLEFKWENVNMQKLAIDVVAFSSIGLDPLQPNHINLICYKNNRTNKFDVGFIMGYNGIELKARKYGLDGEVPDDIIIELVYENDKFKQVKKDANNAIETYTFDIVDDFDRGTLKGGFYYKKFNNDPTKNQIKVMNIHDIEKRKPTYASAEFWGGEKPVYKSGKKSNETEKVEGWYDEMCWKTIKRAAWGTITIDSEKIDENYHRLVQNDMDRVSSEVQNEIDENANGQVIDIDSEQVDDQKQLPQAEQPAEVEENPTPVPENVDKETGEIKEGKPGKQEPLF